MDETRLTMANKPTGLTSTVMIERRIGRAERCCKTTAREVGDHHAPTLPGRCLTLRREMGIRMEYLGLGMLVAQHTTIGAAREERKNIGTHKKKK